MNTTITHIDIEKYNSIEIDRHNTMSDNNFI